MGLRRVQVFVKGPGSGREAAVRAMANAGLEVTQLSIVHQFLIMDAALQNVEEFNQLLI